MEDEIDKFMSVALSLTKDVGKIIRDKLYDTKRDVETKAHIHDFVTETDKEVEKLLISGLSSNFPDHKFIGEETSASGVKIEFTDEPTWIIDPIDGTLNFVHGYPNVCVSIGLTIKKRLALGIIYVPATDFMFTAIKGKGAYLNGKKIHVSNTKDLKEALLIIEFSSSVNNVERQKTYLSYAEKFMGLIHGIRSNGSAALNMAMVALGGGDCYFEIGIHAWDMAAGAIIIEEAGGVVLDCSGNEFNLMNRRVLCASTKELALQFSKYIIQTYPTPDDA